MGNHHAQDDDLLIFADEDLDGFESVEGDGQCWHVLIVDDEPHVHDATRFALADFKILGRPVEFSSAYSAAEAREMLQKGPRFACILLDVVMESEDAGLKLVSYIRETIHELSSRIILRTGQPGYAPELDVIQQYDINDYKSKSELTSNRLITTLISAIRSYQQLEMINANRQGLAMIIDGASELFKERAVDTFSRGVLMQLCSLLQINRNGFMCCHEDSVDHEIKVVAAFGRFEPYAGSSIDRLQDEVLKTEVKQVLKTRQHLIDETHVVLYLLSPHDDELVVRVETSRPMSELDVRLIELFSVHISVGFDNARLFERVEHLAYIDSLTGLPNRTGFLFKLGKLMLSNKPFSLVLADIDNFQAVNDGLGHTIGDKTLLKTAQHLRSFFGDECLMGRISADNFCILLPGINESDLSIQVNKLNESLAHGFSIAGNEVPVSLTIGIALYPTHGKDAETLLQNAGIALKHSKRTQRASFSIFGTEFEQELQQRLQIALELRHSVERKQLILHFQPQVSLVDRKVVGVEALLRWQRDGELVPPDLFIPAAETSGHIVSMGAWVLEEACRQQVLWAEETGQSIRMAVNVSIRQLKDADFLKMLDDVLLRTAINPHCLELEITESMVMEDHEALIDILNAIRSRNIQVAMDDFGTGYSSLSYLRQLPIDRLKIDRAFTNKITVGEQDKALADLMIKMGHLVNLKVIAEGVESEVEEAMLIALGCDEAQGYFYSRPLDSAQFIDFLKKK